MGLVKAGHMGKGSVWESGVSGLELGVGVGINILRRNLNVNIKRISLIISALCAVYVAHVRQRSERFPQQQ